MTAPTCEVCGKSTRGDSGRCTNGRCEKCHRAYCGPGGDTSPGHGRRWPSAPTIQKGTRCDNWRGRSRCERNAETHLIAPDGKRVPGGPICMRCAQACIEEYAEKLGESWSHDPARNVGYYEVQL